MVLCSLKGPIHVQNVDARLPTYAYRNFDQNSVLLKFFKKGDSGSDERPRKQWKWSKQWLLQRPTFGQANLLKEIRISEPKDFRGFYFFCYDNHLI